MSVMPTESPPPGLAMVSGLPGAELPVVDAPRRERADAVRNREALLEAARRLLGQCGPDGITMDAVAAEAGVGKGTLFRRFGDRASLFRTLIDDRERAFQEALIRGPAPLGPGAPTRERLIAFGHAMLELIEDHGPLMAAAMPGSRALQYDHPVYIVDRTGTTRVLSQCDEPKVLSVNQLKDGIDGSPAVVGQQLFLRGHGHLYCLEEKS